MEPIKAYYDGNAFVPIEPVNVRKNQAAYITLLEHVENTKEEQPWRKFFGIISKEQGAEIQGALRETERIDSHEW